MLTAETGENFSYGFTAAPVGRKYDKIMVFFLVKTRPGTKAPDDRSKEGTMEKATFAAGCFWGVEEAFRTVPGVIKTTAGYTGGSLADPSYEDVCTDTTGHAEAVQVEFDPARVTFRDLLDVFWRIHDPTTPNRQGPDVGSQYRSAIFFHTPEQKTAALESIKRLRESGAFGRPIVTEVVESARFYPAEEYHQRYLEKRGIKRCGL